jgi:lysozyme
MKTLLLLFTLAAPMLTVNNEPVLVKPNRPVLVTPNRAMLVKPNINKAWYDMLRGVKHFESYRAEAYTCCGGKRTIGYGHTGIAVSKGVISEREASDLLEKELHKYKDVVLSIVKVPLTDNQLAALTSFTYNCGRGALYQLISQDGRLNDGNYQSVSEVLPMYRKAGGKVRKGLVKRRKFEVALWNNSVEHFN